MPITVMLSSTVADLLPDREAAAQGLARTGLVELVGVVPADSPAASSSPYLHTVDLARTCNLYVLLLGGRYGYETKLGKSATEAEYLAAYKSDPTKVIVLRKNVKRVGARQKAFTDMVADYHKGYFVSRYTEASEVEGLAGRAFQSWICERAAIGLGLNYFDHFVRLAVQRQPFPGVHAEYRVTADTVELTYRLPGHRRSVHFEKAHVYADFWGCFVSLELAFEEWRSGS